MKKIETVVKMCNKLVHEMAKVLFKGLDDNFFDLFQDMNNLFDKIGKFWVMKFKIPCNAVNSTIIKHHVQPVDSSLMAISVFLAVAD